MRFLSSRVLRVGTGLLAAAILLQSASSPGATLHVLPLCAEASPAPAALAASWFPRDGELARVAGGEALARGDARAAACYLERARLGLPGSAQVYLALGDAQATLGAWAQATAAWEEALALGAQPEACLQRLSAAYQAQGEWTQAVSALRRWLLLHPDDAEAAYRLALILSSSDPLAAQQELRDLEAEGSSPLVSRAEALGEVITEAQATGDQAFVLARTGEFLLRQREWALARTALQGALDLNPGYGEAMAYLAVAAEQAGESPAEMYARAVELSPTSPLAHLLYGSFLGRQDQLQAARKELEQAWALDAHNPLIASERGKVEFAAGDLPAAEFWYAESVRVAPEDAEAWLARALFYVSNQLRVGAEGVDSAREAVRLNPADPRAVDVLGLAWYLQGDSPTAERLFWRALDLDPAFAPAYLHLGMSAESRGSRDQARAYYQRAAMLDPQGSAGAAARAAQARLGTGN